MNSVYDRKFSFFQLMMLLLCGCRVRVSNNSEVLATLDDDGGWLEQTYQERRDELGIPVAKEPLINREGEESYDEEDDEYYEEEDEEYYEEDEEYYDEEDEEEEDEDESDSPAVRGTVPGRPQSPGRLVYQRPSTTVTRPQTPVAVTVKVLLDPNASDAKCSTTSVLVRKGSVYGTMPLPTREGYTFEGWYTEKKKGKEVTSGTKVTTEKTHTLYAHWKKAEKKRYTISFDINVPKEEAEKVSLKKSEISVEEGGKYGGLESMPSPVWEKHKFEGWYTEAGEGEGTKVGKSDKFTGNADQTLYAHWSDDTLGWWDKRFSETANKIEADSKVTIAFAEKPDDHDKKLAEDCRVTLAKEGETPEYIVKFIRNYSYESAEAEAKKTYDGISADNPDVKVVIVSDEAHKGSDEQKLLYRMMLMDTIYGSFGSEIDEAAEDLDATVNYPYVYSNGSAGPADPVESVESDETIESIETIESVEQ